MKRFVNQVELVIPAAYHGCVEVLFAAAGSLLWGAFDPKASTIRLEKEDEELIDLAVVHTVQNGGTMYLVDQAEMPG